MPRAVLFDLDGVLVDTYDVWHALANAFAREHGYAEISAAQMKAGWGQGVDADARLFFGGHPVAELAAYYDLHFLDHLEQLTVARGAVAVLEALAARDVSTCVVTNTPATLAVRLLQLACLAPDALVGGTDVPRPKPAPDMVLRACKLLAVEPGDAILIGDSPFDRDAATAAGVPFVAYRWDGGRRIETLEEILAIVQV